jgi:glutamate racemase
MLGIIDWGIGGIGVYKALKERLGDVPVAYFSDTGATPYGKMSKRDLIERLDQVIAFLKGQGAANIVIACNAASTAIAYLDKTGVTIEGVIDSAVKLTVRSRPKRLGLIGGRRTILSGVYRKAFATKGIKVEQRIAQPLSGLIEAGDISSDMLRSAAMHILTPLKNCSHILLACTHYPAIENLLAEYVSSDTIFIDPANEVVKIVERLKWPQERDDVFFTTGDPATMKGSARKAFGVEIPLPIKIKSLKAR